MICRAVLVWLAMLACGATEAAILSFRPIATGQTGRGLAVSSIRSSLRVDAPAVLDKSESMAARVFWRVITPGEYRRVSAAADARARLAADAEMHVDEMGLAVVAATAPESAQHP